MPGKQDVVAGGAVTEHNILNDVVGLVFKEKVPLVLLNIHIQRNNFLIFQGVHGRLGGV